MRGRVLALLIVAATLVPAAPAAPQQYPSTLRAALLQSHFEDATRAADAPDLDEPLTSWVFTATEDAFVAGYYLQKELKPRQILGPLHVSLFRRASGRWISASNFEEGGSVVEARIASRYVILELHVNPSRGTGLVLDPRNLAVLASLDGFGLLPLDDGSVLYRASMVHFAPTHQERLVEWQPVTHKETEVFPGGQESRLARTYRQTVLALAHERGRDVDRSAYGPVDDFDRAIGDVTEDPTRKRVAFTVSYTCDRLRYPVDPGARSDIPTVRAVAVCGRNREGWSCNERELFATAKELGVRLMPNGDRIDDRELRDLIAAVLKR